MCGLNRSMVTINKRPAAGGFYFELADFAAYANALQQQGIEPPRAAYRLFVSVDGDRKLSEFPDDWRRQLEVFYRLGAATDIPYKLTECNAKGP